jgi:hypothetical protein
MHLDHGLPFFHALTGCDTVSAFRGKSKRTAWEIFDDATDTFVPLSEIPAAIGDQDKARFEMFSRRKSQCDTIPPTRAALLEHTY